MKAFLAHSLNSSPGRHSAEIAALPDDLGEIIGHVRGLLIHGDQLALYDLRQSGFSNVSRETLPLKLRLDQILGNREKSLLENRKLSQRTIGTCRDYALMTCGFLREKEIPARVRCGFARYFFLNKFEDHWICEAWQSEVGEWRRIDAQLDEVHQKHFGIAFDTTFLPEGEFLTSTEAWSRYRDGVSDPNSFGHGEATGAWFLWVNLARDLLSLSGREISDWDGWRDISADQLQMTDTDHDACEEVARAIRDIENGVTGTRGKLPLQPFWKSEIK